MISLCLQMFRTAETECPGEETDEHTPFGVHRMSRVAVGVHISGCGLAVHCIGETTERPVNMHIKEWNGG